MKALFQNKLKVILAFALTLSFTACDIGGGEDPILLSPDAESITDY